MAFRTRFPSSFGIALREGLKSAQPPSSEGFSPEMGHHAGEQRMARQRGRSNEDAGCRWQNAYPDSGVARSDYRRGRSRSHSGTSPKRSQRKSMKERT